MSTIDLPSDAALLSPEELPLICLSESEDPPKFVLTPQRPWRKFDFSCGRYAVSGRSRNERGGLQLGRESIEILLKSDVEVWLNRYTTGWSLTHATSRHVDGKRICYWVAIQFTHAEDVFAFTMKWS